MAKLNYNTRAGGAWRGARGVGAAALGRLHAIHQGKTRNEPNWGRKSLFCRAVRGNHEPIRSQATQGKGGAPEGVEAVGWRRER
jgi:hypothetical protein